MKKIGKAFVLWVLTRQLRRLLAKNQVKVVGVVGSYGKTSTKLALATVLSQKFRVQHQEGNYNDIVTVPLIFFGESTPSLMNPLAWTAVFMRNARQLRRPYPYDVVVLELGTDGPGQIERFKRYVQLDMAVVTAIAYEHMEFFADVDAVAHEELAVANFSRQLIVNRDLCPAIYLDGLQTQVITYGLDGGDFQALNGAIDGDRLKFAVNHAGKQLFGASAYNSSQSVQYSALAAVAVGTELGMSAAELTAGIAAIEPAAGRMRHFQGVHNIMILDDTYNASPEAVKASLDTLYASPIGPKFALLGSMNELGKFSPDAHLDVGNYCNPAQLDTVLTLGADANKYLAEAARQNGCNVVEFTSPYAAGTWLAENMPEGAILLAKGSQNGVFAEEAIKLLLANPEDASKLVRQSAYWMKVKRGQFKDAV